MLRDVLCDSQSSLVHPSTDCSSVHEPECAKPHCSQSPLELSQKPATQQTVFYKTQDSDASCLLVTQIQKLLNAGGKKRSDQQALDCSQEQFETQMTSALDDQSEEAPFEQQHPQPPNTPIAGYSSALQHSEGSSEDEAREMSPDDLVSARVVFNQRLLTRSKSASSLVAS